MAPEHKMGHQKLVWLEQQSRDSSRGVDLKVKMIWSPTCIIRSLDFPHCNRLRPECVYTPD